MLSTDNVENKWGNAKAKDNGTEGKKTWLWNSYSIEDKDIYRNNQYKEIENNSWMGRTRYLLNKVRQIRTNFCVKINLVKQKNHKNLMEDLYMQNYLKVFQITDNLELIIWNNYWSRKLFFCKKHIQEYLYYVVITIFQTEYDLRSYLFVRRLCNVMLCNITHTI